MAEQKQGPAAKFLKWMIAKHPDALFAFIRRVRPNLALGAAGPVFITRFPDVQEALSRPDIFNVTYAPMMDPSVGPFMLGRDCTEINQRDKGIMRAFMRMEDLPAIRQKVRSLANYPEPDRGGQHVVAPGAHSADPRIFRLSRPRSGLDVPLVARDAI
ncbi:hypothetical protein QIH93_35360 [Bradyrhizobium ottawaense]|uniref:hypothetical protein n=1 Tax=Bradyrhizobium ottawaense TaxID=931866 RepID=UPI00271460B2|nr:hypothetical protein [Bradyrhizobium ottawaense]WLB45705.1 hypothetical protein QIH93_35360 [Bradyrhizobium ottawaense]